MLGRFLYGTRPANWAYLVARKISLPIPLIGGPVRVMTLQNLLIKSKLLCGPSCCPLEQVIAFIVSILLVYLVCSPSYIRPLSSPFAIDHGMGGSSSHSWKRPEEEKNIDTFARPLPSHAIYYLPGKIKLQKINVVSYLWILLNVNRLWAMLPCTY